MNGKIQQRSCPRCGGTAETTPGQDWTHTAIHNIGHGAIHGNPLKLGVGLIAAGVQLFKKFRYYCRCGHEFWSR